MENKNIQSFGQFNENANPMTIWTVLPYFSNSEEVNQSGVKSFTSFKKAEEYTWTLDYHFDIVENELISE